MRIDGIPSPAQQTIPDGRNLLKIASFALLILACFWVAQWGATALDEAAELVSNAWVLHTTKWLLVFAMATLSSMVVLGLGILAHDAVHRVLFSRLWMNEWLGGFISALALLPFHANRQFHLAHHSYAHQPGRDPENTMHNHPFFYALTVGSLIALWLQYRILLINAFTRLFNRRYTARILQDIVFLSAAGAVYFWLVPLLGLALHYTVLPMLIVLPMVFGYRALSDHYGLPALNRQLKTEGKPNQAQLEAWHGANAPIQEEVTGWVVLSHPILEWLWSNVNYHEVHHKYPYLSYVYLKSVFDLTKDKLPYAVVKGYTHSLLCQRQRQYYEPSLPANEI